MQWPEQEKNVAATQKKVDELNAQQAEAQNVVNSLDSQLQAELAAEAEANAALQAGINASTAEKATVSNRDCRYDREHQQRWPDQQ